MDLLNSNKKLLFERNEAIKLLNGLLDDFKYFIGESDNEPQRAGFIVEAEKFLSSNKVENPIKHPKDYEVFPDSLSLYTEQEKLHLETEEKTFRNPLIFVKK